MKAKHDLPPVLHAADWLSSTEDYVHHDTKGGQARKSLIDRGSGSGVLQRDYDSCLILSENPAGEQFRTVSFITRNYLSPASVSFKANSNGTFTFADVPPVISGSNRKLSLTDTEYTLSKSVEWLLAELTANSRVTVSAFRSYIREQFSVSIRTAKDLGERVTAAIENSDGTYPDLGLEEGSSNRKFIVLKDRPSSIQAVL